MGLELRLVSGIAILLFLSSFFILGFVVLATPPHGPVERIEGSQAVLASDSFEGGLETLCAWRTHDPCAPHVEVTLPNGGEVLRGVERIEWAAIDFQGEQLVYDLYYSSDGGANWMTIAAGLTTRGYEWDTTKVSDGDNYLVRVDVLGGGVASGRDQSNSVFSVDNLAGGESMQKPLNPFAMAIVAGIIGVVAIAGIVLLVRRGV